MRANGTCHGLNLTIELIPNSEFWGAVLRKMVHLLLLIQCLDKIVHPFLDGQYYSADDFCSELAQSIQRYLARSRSMLLMVQLEDLLSEANQVNVPGTIDEYPNWRRKLSLNLEHWSDRIDLEGFAHVINAERNA